MDIVVVAETELALLVASPYDEVVCDGILKLDDASVFDCEDLLRSNGQLWLARQQ